MQCLPCTSLQCCCHSSPTHRAVQVSKRSTELQQPLVSVCDRRQALAGLVGLTTGVQQLSQSAAALPGFKKELGRKKAVAADQYKPGPQGLKYYDLLEGTGDKAREGQRVAVHFEAKWKGVTFMTSRQGLGVTGGTPLGFDIGADDRGGGTLKGLDLGVRGMRVNGQRKLIVPPELAYGNRGYGGEIPPNATLEIDVQLLSIKKDARGYQTKLVEG